LLGLVAQSGNKQGLVWISTDIWVRRRIIYNSLASFPKSRSRNAYIFPFLPPVVSASSPSSRFSAFDNSEGDFLKASILLAHMVLSKLLEIVLSHRYEAFCVPLMHSRSAEEIARVAEAQRARASWAVIDMSFEFNYRDFGDKRLFLWHRLMNKPVDSPCL
jgi:hypothetical protein